MAKQVRIGIVLDNFSPHVSHDIAAWAEAHNIEITRQWSVQLTKTHNLLARIHRDGGHYTQEHGLEKSMDDAETRVVELFDKLDCAVAKAKEPA